MAKHNDIGKIGEELALAWFIAKGYSIIFTNWQSNHLEVDIIATKNEILHFVEVKTVSTNKFGNPEEKVSKKKITNLINASEDYLFQYPEWKRIQFDVMAIKIIKNTPVEYFLIEDVYL